MDEYVRIFTPLLNQFNQAQVTAIFMAWLPTKLQPYLSSVMAVDMFITCTIATALTALLGALYHFTKNFVSGATISSGKNLTVQVEEFTTGKYGYQQASEFHEGLSWLISNQTMELEMGNFILKKPAQIANFGTSSQSDTTPAEFHILPEANQEMTIEFNGLKFEITPKVIEEPKKDNSYVSQKRKTSLFLTPVNRSAKKVGALAEFISGVTGAHLEYLKSQRVRSHYERSGATWKMIQPLSANRGLATVSLNPAQEELVRRELETFVSDKDFYATVGIPYRRGILLYGMPGTGKTSLINAISAELKRDLYFINLRKFGEKDPDGELSAAFSSVPANQIIVLEDIDTQTKVVHNRKNEESSSSLLEKSLESVMGFSLSTFLNCLDGHCLQEGIIIIMTTNHVEKLDPAVIRPGRMDLQLNLGYCTHYQIKSIFSTVVQNKELEFPQEILKRIPEGLLPPCQVMTTMMLYRKEPNLIPQKLLALAEKTMGNTETDKNEESASSPVEASWDSKTDGTEHADEESASSPVEASWDSKTDGTESEAETIFDKVENEDESKKTDELKKPDPDAGQKKVQLNSLKPIIKLDSPITIEAK